MRLAPVPLREQLARFFQTTTVSKHADRRKIRSRRLFLESLEQRTVLSVTVNSSFAGLDFNASGGYVPPDTNGAAGPSSYVETVNQEVAIYPRSAGSSVATPLSNFWFTNGGLAHADSSSGLSDPVVTYDNLIGRFVVADQDVNFTTHVSRFDVAVSKTNNPATLTSADWSFYQVNTTQTNEDADYPGNIGYNADGVVFTLNMFAVSGTTGTGHTQVVTLSSADLSANVAQANLHIYQNNLADFSVRPTTMHTSVTGDPMWFVTEHGDNKSIDVYKMTGELTNTASFTSTNLAVASYSSPVNPLNPNGTVITNNMDGRILKSAESNTTIVAAHTVSISATQDVVQWYNISVSSGTPTLADQGRVGGANKTYAFFPSIDINSSNQIGMTYMLSGNDTTTDYMSAYVTGRLSTDVPGTMETSVVIPAGKGLANYKDFSSGGRAGDLSGINLDPTDGSFWAVNEFANTQSTANWGTAVAHFSLGAPLPATDVAVTATGPSSVNVSSGATTATYVITITNTGTTASNVTFVDTIPTGSTLSSLTQTSGSDAFTISGASASVGTMPSGGTDTFTLVVNAPTSRANGAAFNNQAVVSENNIDSNTANNTAITTGTVVNTNANADVSVTETATASASEGGTITYTITVKNNGPLGATGIVLTDSLSGLTIFTSGTITNGSGSYSNGVVTNTIGSLASGATATLTVVTQATEGGTAVNTASITSTSPDPVTSNNTATRSTLISEPAITVSAPKSTTSKSLSGYTTATFTHANGIEAASAFTATINWGDGTTSAGTITLSGTSYTVKGSHTYSSTGNHTITTTVVESGSSPDSKGADNEVGDKGAGDHPGQGPANTQDIVRLPLKQRIKLYQKLHPKAPAHKPVSHPVVHHAATKSHKAPK